MTDAGRGEGWTNEGLATRLIQLEGILESIGALAGRDDMILDDDNALREAARRLRARGPELGSCRICDRPTDGVTICRYCDRMMEHLDGVIGHHREKVRQLAKEFEHRWKMQGSEFHRGKWSAFKEVLEALPLTMKDEKHDPYDYETHVAQWATGDIARMLERFAEADFDHGFHAVLTEAAHRLRGERSEVVSDD